jgi:hypothetical protein
VLGYIHTGKQRGLGPHVDERDVAEARQRIGLWRIRVRKARGKW